MKNNQTSSKNEGGKKQMSKIEEYRKMKEEANKLMTQEAIHNFIKKHKFLPMGMIDELQTKLNIINQENKKKGIGVVHVIHVG